MYGASDDLPVPGSPRSSSGRPVVIATSTAMCSVAGRR